MRNLIPQIRFQCFSENLVTNKLNQYLEKVSKKNKTLEYTEDDMLSVSSSVGVVNQKEHHGRSFAGASVAPYNILEYGQVVYTKSPLKEFPYGIIKYNNYKSGIVSTLYAVYSLKNTADGKFIDFYFQNPLRLAKFLKPLVNKGAKNDMKVNNDTAISGEVAFPSLPEQKKIADFLSAVDKKIDLLSRKKELMSQYKKGVMQQIFSQKIRFKDDNGNDFPEWSHVRAKKVFENYTNKNHDGDLPILAVTQDDGVVLRDSLDKKIDSSVSGIKNYKIIEPGNFVISLRSFQGGLEYSEIRGISSPAYTVLKSIVEISDDFYKNYFKKEDFISMLNSAVIGIRDGKQISYSVFSDLRIPYPHPEEQKRIASFLNALDRKISHIEAELHANQQFKKALLQQMFV